ncbi:MAG TPA: class D sortase [Thermoanaerobaculia bacterium]|nr:class D sortase [Thermoanaerobaculia bacterium]
MKPLRGALAFVFVTAGVLLIGAAGLHYARGARAQSEGRRILDRTARGGYVTATNPQERVSARDELPRSAGSGSYGGYPTGTPLGRIRIPIAEMDWVVFAGSDDGTLEKGPGHVPGTAMPNQDYGPNNCVITAHRDSHFRRLGWLRKGHLVELETATGTTKYRVMSREIVTPKTVRVLKASPKPRLTLITCYPFDYVGSAPKRLIVVAEPIGKRPPQASTVSAN